MAEGIFILKGDQYLVHAPRASDACTTHFEHVRYYGLYTLVSPAILLTRKVISQFNKGWVWVSVVVLVHSFYQFAGQIEQPPDVKFDQHNIGCSSYLV